MRQTWEGIFAALWSPTDADHRLLEAQLKLNLEFILEHGVQGIMVCGSTGEFPFLTVDQKQRLLRLVVETCGTRPVIANISDLSAATVAQLGQMARHSGAAAVAVLPPWFYPVNQPDLVEFFVRAGDASGLPLWLYNFPERSGNRIGLETIAAVAERVPLAGVKQSGAEFEYHRELVRLGGEKGFVVFTGSDTRLAEAMNLGVAGSIGGLANAVPDLMVKLFHAIQSADAEETTRITAQLQALGTLIDRLDFPLNVAALMAARGLAAGVPKRPLSSQTETGYRKLVYELRDFLRNHGLAHGSGPG